MEVFVTGATGVLGRAAVPLLVEAGHRVRGLARSDENDRLLRSMDAEPARADLFDAKTLREAVAGSDAVLHLATKIPPSAWARQRAAWLKNDRTRVEGTRNLVDAALGAGVATLLYPSVCLLYPDGGDACIDAGTPPSPSGIVRSTLAAEAEVARFTAGGGRGVVLRMGSFYGPRAGSTLEQLRLARRGAAMVLGPGDAYQPSIWVDDAAAAVVAALQGAPAGIYDVADDEPLRRRELAAAMARAVGRRSRRRLPAWLVRLVGGVGVEAVSRSQRVSNRRFKEASAWGPAVPDARIGWARIAATVGRE